MKDLDLHLLDHEYFRYTSKLGVHKNQIFDLRLTQSSKNVFCVSVG